MTSWPCCTMFSMAASSVWGSKGSWVELAVTTFSLRINGICQLSGRLGAGHTRRVYREMVGPAVVVVVSRLSVVRNSNRPPASWLVDQLTGSNWPTEWVPTGENDP